MLLPELGPALVRHRCNRPRPGPVDERQHRLGLLSYQKPTDKPRRPAAEGKKINPVLAAGGDGELMKRLIAELKAWRRAYLEARDRWRVDKTTTFPQGTWWKVVYDGAAIAA